MAASTHITGIGISVLPKRVSKAALCLFAVQRMVAFDDLRDALPVEDGHAGDSLSLLFDRNPNQGDSVEREGS